MLHAELSNTLKRRKPVVINEPPKYEYPTYDDSNGTSSSGSNGITNGSGSGSGSSSNNNSSVNNKINDSSHSTSVNIATPKPLNVNAVLSVVTGIKLPDTIQYDANVGNAGAGASASSTTDKRKISHGKPNFTINHQKENKPIVVANQSSPQRKASSPKIHVMGGTPVEIKATAAAAAPAVVQPKLQRPSYFTNHSMGSDKTIVKTTPMARPAIDTEGTESGQVEKCRSIFMIKSQKSQDDVAKQITKCPLKSADAGTVKFTNAPSSIGVNEQPKPKLKPKEMLLTNNNKAKISIDESSLSSSTSPLSNGIPFASVANKKALFEKSAQIENHAQKSPVSTLRGAQTEKLYFNKPVSSSSSPSSLSSSSPSPPLTPSASMSNGKANTLNGHRTNGNHKSGGITTVTLNKSISYGGNGGTLDRPKYQRTPSITKDAVDHFARSVHETATSKTTTTTTSTKTLEKTTKTLSTTNQFETKQQFEQKTIVSFSKDLLNAPNNYPEQIRVKKTIINETSHRSPAIADTPFHNIRFSIQTNGQVIPKAK